MTASTEPTVGPVAKLTEPGDIVVMIPYLLGFQPTDSLVVVSLEGPRKRFGPIVRLDLVDGSKSQVAEQVDYLLGFIEAHRFHEVIVVAYSAEPRRAGRVVRPLLKRLRTSRVDVAEAVRADGDRWFSYVCHKACCPVVGVPYDPTSARSAAEAVAYGLTRAESRDALRARFAPAPPEVMDDIQAEVSRVQDDVGAGTVDLSDLVDLLEGAAGNVVSQVAALLVLSQDASWPPMVVTRMSRASAERDLLVWSTVMRVATEEQLAGPGSLAAFSAWLNGNGVLASHALDRMAEVGASSPLADLVRNLLDHTVPPDLWDEIEREEVAGMDGYVSHSTHPN